MARRTSTQARPRGATPRARAAAPVPELPSPLVGVDVSHHNGAVSWPAVARAGAAFAYAKATEGEAWLDARFSGNWAAMRAAGVLRGAYHFFRPARDPLVQADHFCAVVGPLGPGDLPPAIDVEETAKKGEWLSIPTRAERVARVAAFTSRVAERLGRPALVYTGTSFWRATLGPPGPLAGLPLWLARYSTVAPTPPAGWSRWTFWQHSQTGRVAGVSGPVDLDRFDGTHDALRALAGLPPLQASAIG